MSGCLLLYFLFTVGLKVPLSASALRTFLLSKVCQGQGSDSVSSGEETVMTKFEAAEVSTALGEGLPWLSP